MRTSSPRHRRRLARRPLRFLSVALLDHTAQVLAVESRPGGPVYFSDATSIHKLTMAG